MTPGRKASPLCTHCSARSVIAAALEIGVRAWALGWRFWIPACAGMTVGWG